MNKLLSQFNLFYAKFKSFFSFLGKYFTREQKRSYGWVKSKVDPSDKKFSIQPPVELPTKIDISTVLPPVFDQGSLGSCTGNAVASAVEFDQIIENKAFDMTFSRLFSYYNTRSIEGTVNSDSGGTIRDAVAAINMFGICKESLWPYIISKFKIKPSDAAYAEAVLHKSIDFSYIDNTNVNNLKTCLASNRPFVFGFQVFEAFESEAVAKTGMVPMPVNGEACLGGHCVLGVGYDDSKQAFLIRNSWGKNWGIDGHFWMPYEYITNPQLACDFWVIRTIVLNQE